MIEPTAEPRQATAPAHWLVCIENGVSWREWGDEYVVHVNGRAETHLLSVAAGSVLMELQQASGPIRLDTLFDRVFADTSQGAAMSAQERAALIGILDDFERLGLANYRLRP